MEDPNGLTVIAQHRIISKEEGAHWARVARRVSKVPVLLVDKEVELSPDDEILDHLAPSPDCTIIFLRMDFLARTLWAKARVEDKRVMGEERGEAWDLIAEELITLVLKATRGYRKDLEADRLNPEPTRRME